MDTLRLSLAILALGATTAWSADIPTRDFFRDTEFKNVQLSPDGSNLAVLTKLGEDETYNLVVVNLDNKKMTQITSIAGKRNRGLSWYRWISPSRLVFRYGELYSVGLDGKRAKKLKDTTYWGQNPSQYEWFFCSKRFGAIHRCSVASNAAKKIGDFPGQSVGLLLDWHGEPRFARSVEIDDGTAIYELLYRPAGGKWRTIHEYEYGAEGEITPVAFSRDNETVYAVSDIGRSTRALYEFDPESGSLGRQIYAHDVYDIRGVLTIDAADSVGGVFYNAEEPMTVWLEPERRAIAQAIDAALPDYNNSIDFSENGQIALVRSSNDRDPGGYWIYNSVDGSLTELLKHAAWLEPQDMAPVRPVTYEARDGLEIRGYLTLPIGSGDRKPPLLIYPHGGPLGVRNVVAFDRPVQFFANRGFAVFQPDFRGSGGYGTEFRLSGWRQHGRKMIDDINDGVRWVLSQGHTDPDRVCIYGGSYGGMAAMMSAAKEPDLYRCAASFAGVMDLRRMATYGNNEWADISEKVIGDFFADKDMLRASSPIHNADAIKCPVLLLHGKRDGVVHWHHTDLMERALREAGNEPEVHYYEDEGHGIYDEDTRVEMYDVIDRFLARHLK